MTMDRENSSCYRYNFALVSRIPESFEEKSSFDMIKPHDRIDIEKARNEHEELVEDLRKIGVDVIELPNDETHPDGLFVHDIAVVINETALICQPPSFPDKPSRDGELAVVRQVLRKEIGLKIINVSDTSKATVEGGDVLWTGKDIFVGISRRTNVLGAQAVAKAFPEYPTYMVKVSDPAVHLCDVISMCGPGVLSIAKSECGQKVFAQIKDTGVEGYKYVLVEEENAANVIYCNNTLLTLSSEQIPKGFAVYENKIDFRRVAIKMEEPLKRGGKLGSCVLLVNRSRNLKNIPYST